jgi:hypothetical protein
MVIDTDNYTTDTTNNNYGYWIPKASTKKSIANKRLEVHLSLFRFQLHKICNHCMSTVKPMISVYLATVAVYKVITQQRLVVELLA